MCIDLHFWPNVGHDGDIVSHIDTQPMVTRTAMWLVRVGYIPYVCLLHSPFYEMDV